jgi:5-methylcytosine-specific restriction endonuclease McrA
VRRKPIDLKTPEGRKRFYQSNEWRVLREVKLANDPWCEKCLNDDHIKILAEDVHHIIDIKTDPTKCLEYANLKSLCKACHSSITYNDNKTSFGKPKIFEVVNRKWDMSGFGKSADISVNI